MSSSDESFHSFAASSSGSVTDSLADQSWFDESLCSENEQEFSSYPMMETGIKNTICVTVEITNLEVNILIDIGAARSCISENLYHNIDERKQYPHEDPQIDFL